MVDVLEKIVAHKRAELEGYNFDGVEQKARAMERKTISISRSIKSSTKGGIIAELKRRSPSKGWINEGADVEAIVAGYRESGAAACSVLTNEEFFGGSLDFLKRARAVAGDMPLLRKEFIVDPRQIYEARVAGADAILLIASCLTVSECNTLAEVAHSVDLEVLLEIHSEAELSHLNQYIDMLGVNNRNLGTFVTDINNSFNLAEVMRQRGGDIVLVSESGIDASETIKSLQEVGFGGFLIGETFMKTENPPLALANLIAEIC
ncbi:MAG: indole-3-glycerol phosphate synthase TrpC [Rikenellaceae bacterium]